MSTTRSIVDRWAADVRQGTAPSGAMMEAGRQQSCSPAARRLANRVALALVRRARAQGGG